MRPERYLIVVGSRGVGKSFLVSKLLKERRKVVYVKLRAKKTDILDVMRSKLGINENEAFELEDLFLPFTELRGTEKPVLVVEIEGTVDDADAMVASQSQILKALCDDLGLALGILILSNANAAAWLKQDASRQNFLWMGEFDPDQAHQYLDNRRVLLTDGDDANVKLRRQLSEEVSTNARFLRLVADEATTDAADKCADAKEEGKAERDAAMRQAERDAATELMDAWKEAAVKDLKYLVTREPNDDDPCQWRRSAMEEIVRALVQKPSGIEPEAVLLPKFSVQLLMASLGELRQDIKSTVVMFNRESELLTFVSPAHQIAARNWVKENPVPA